MRIHLGGSEPGVLAFAMLEELIRTLVAKGTMTPAEVETIVGTVRSQFSRSGIAIKLDIAKNLADYSPLKG